MTNSFSLEQLFNFVSLASQSTYASGKPPVTTSQRPDFVEYVFSQAEWSYLDSYTGHTTAVGQEVVRFQDQIVWANSYCGGMISGSEQMAEQTYLFLKQALSQPKSVSHSLRGPASFQVEDWSYHYQQIGSIDNYVGYEEILLAGKVVFFHRNIGGMINY